MKGDGARREGKEDVVPKAAKESDISKIKADYKACAKRAKRAGFDGIELHCGYGYLLDCFLRDGTNQRTDKYGGSIEGRCRLPLDILDILIGVFGADRCGIKLTLHNSHNDMSDKDPDRLLAHLISKLNARKVAFLEMAEGLG